MEPSPNLPMNLTRLAKSAFLVLILMVCGMGNRPATVSTPLTIEGLYAECGLPAPCDAAAPWEGRETAIVAQVDGVNIFDHDHYPQLPYEKFRLIDGRGRSIEVYPQASDNRPIFAKLRARPSGEIVVRGRLALVKMPITGNCNQGIKVIIDAADQIEYNR